MNKENNIALINEDLNVVKAVKRNIDRFPQRFMFQLNEDEYNYMWSQIGTTYRNEMQKYRWKEHLPYAFTEQGIAMLATVIKNEIAIQVSINIMDAFVEMRKFLSNNGQIFERLTNVEYKLLEHDNKFQEVFNQFQHKENVKQKVFFDGKVYDAFSMIINLIKKSAYIIYCITRGK